MYSQVDKSPQASRPSLDRFEWDPKECRAIDKKPTREREGPGGLEKKGNPPDENSAFMFAPHCLYKEDTNGFCLLCQGLWDFCSVSSLYKWNEQLSGVKRALEKREEASYCSLTCWESLLLEWELLPPAASTAFSPVSLANSSLDVQSALN